MAKRSSYTPGTFSWVDLATTDAAAAKAFYSALFGWEMEDREGRGGAAYTLCRLDGDAVCALYAMPDEMRATGVPPHWLSYVSVDDADAVAARAREVGGHVIDDAFDVGDTGRMAVLRDPQGAVVALWQPRARIGAERVNDVGCLCMNELVTTDMDAAGSFYERLFGWTIAAGDEAAPGPTMVLNRGDVNAAMFPSHNGASPHWRPCFTVESTDRALQRTRELGGKPLGEPVDIGHGSIAMLRDPQGALFTVFAGETEP